MSLTNKILMIRPTSFSYNHETAVNNHYQKKTDIKDFSSISKKVTSEFDEFKLALERCGIHVYCFEDIPSLQTPDSLFPNNWISTHKDGFLFLYPMFADNRRRERRQDIIDFFVKKNRYSKIIDIASLYEEKNEFLEGTGSMVLDRFNKIVYAAISDRTHISPLSYFCEKINFELISFHASQKFEEGEQLIYHTNVMMSLCENFVIICLESIKNEIERKKILESFSKTGKQVIDISYDQVKKFCGNVLELKSNESGNILAMSTAAYNAFSVSQKGIIKNFCKIVHSPLGNIEKYGGGGARCMIAEIFFKPIKN